MKLCEVGENNKDILSTEETGYRMYSMIYKLYGHIKIENDNQTSIDEKCLKNYTAICNNVYFVL